MKEDYADNVVWAFFPFQLIMENIQEKLSTSVAPVRCFKQIPEALHIYPQICMI